MKTVSRLVSSIGRMQKRVPKSIKLASWVVGQGGGGDGNPLYKPYRYVPPHRVWFLRRFGLKTGIDLHILV